MSTTLNITLQIIMALESSGGRDLAHATIENPRSIHRGTAAIGRYGMMPVTLRELGLEHDDEAAARVYAAKILSRTGRGCPLRTAVVLWERGPNHQVKRKSWDTNRLEKALKVWKGPIKRTQYAGRSFQ